MKKIIISIKKNMKEVFISIKKKWLQYRVNKYTLKIDLALSKIEHYNNLSEKFKYLAEGSLLANNILEYLKKSEKYHQKSIRYNHISNIFTQKKKDFEDRLLKLKYPNGNVLMFRKKDKTVK